ncbi:sensor histidine kinase [Ornithinibacillus hominis]|uniref:histidine kinase n=1 Tax=Ornithinibacillus hominis TaxID=2763055 RepID=A0A923L851_9BACI|nr:sensor histidine kinase [Ornithinibacillus hominis]MBC5638328.1 sensor histidine kinase [Ornithinibacillus hominis]
MKKSYFIWLAIYGVVWVFAYLAFPSGINKIQLTSMCVFFIILFILPITANKPIWQTILFSIQALTTIGVFHHMGSMFNPYVFLLHALIIAEAVFYLNRLKSFIVIGVQLICAFVIMMEANLSTTILVWYGLLYSLIITALFYFQTVHIRENELSKKYDVLLDEYRKMKRQLMIEEEQARLDERNMIGREIHDSVGHKLTALLMQFEAFRLNAVEQDKEKMTTLKELISQSLEETRKAVKSFKQPEVGGLQGIIRLIRKLEIESYMKIHFSVKHGAFAAPLSGEQSFAIYRAVQEALTNIMKHSSTREARVMFESPGRSIFRFEVINQTTSNYHFQEGYGLKAMRERLEKVGGSLDVTQDEHQFRVKGVIRLIERGGQYD